MSIPSEAGTLSEIASAAAHQVRSLRPSSILEKSPQDFVTDLDRTLEDQIASALRHEFPGIPILGEESIGTEDRIPADAFLIDPLDGTGNWIAGIGFCAVSIARLVDGHTTCAAVADVYSGVIYTAAAGRGAYRDARRLSMPDQHSTLFGLSTGLLSDFQGSDAFGALRAVGKLRNLGAQALQLCLVASGSLSFVASKEAKLWDDAAGRLIVAEAGGRYLSGVDPSEGDRPSADQFSLAAHPGVLPVVGQVLSPYLKLSV